MSNSPKQYKSGFEKFLTFIEDQLILLGCVFLFMMMLLVTADVTGRYFFNKPIAGQIEITEMFMVLSIYLGMAYTQREKGHVGMDLFVNKVLRGTANRISNFLVLILSLIINLLIAYYSFTRTITTYQQGGESMYLGIPMWPLPLFVSIGSIVLCLRLIYESKESITKDPTVETYDQSIYEQSNKKM
ncbi:TRAP transporter small permease [Bacillus dakarensis]|uniref:TRAP transporter small permease n=1 Tax=Robertmurraya dakarensis TaxID=1926278 RepID=UPI000981B1EF|nr:TRAP transporter small permease [Bacillus dakarensis]